MANYTSGSSEVVSASTYVLAMLGSPVVTVELDTIHIVESFNNAISEYSNYITEWAIKNNISNALGLPQATDFTARWISQDLSYVNSIARSYSEQANIGGNIRLARDFFIITGGTQDYYLPEDIVISEVLWADTPAIQKVMVDPYSVDNWAAMEFGWSYNYRPLSVVTPLYYSISKSQNYEMRNRLYSSDFYYINIPTTGSSNTIQLYPPPRESLTGTKVFYWYKTNSDLNLYESQTGNSVVNNPGTMRLDEISYSDFNSTAKRWVKQYTLASCKEILGRIRGKFSELSIPDAAVSMDGPALLDEGRQEKEKLITELKELLDSIDVKNMVDGLANTAQQTNVMLSYNPMGIYVL